jgi:exodeoxyribonuclease-1
MISPARGCLAVMWPLATHPTNKNEVICWDLAADPAELSGISIEDLRLRLFTRQAELPEGVSRLPIKSIHVNKSPMVVGSLKTLSPAMAEKWGVDMELAMQHAAIARDLPDMSAQWKAVFTREAGEPLDADQDLYGGFVGNEDRRRLERIKRLSPQELALDKTGFDDARLTELVWRYRARNFPQTLDAGEQQRWEQHRAACLIEGQGGHARPSRCLP